jgi:hypothetical protein
VPASSTIHYCLVHPLHRVHARSSTFQAKALLRDDGTLLAGALVATTSFRSGDPDRDARVFEVAGAQVGFKGQARLEPAACVGTVHLTVAGELTLNRVSRPLAVPLAVEFAPDGTARVRGSFEVSLEAHRIERPSLLLMKVEDTLRIELDLAFAREA